MEDEMEAKVSDLLVDRERMTMIIDQLKDETRILQDEILKHTGSECGGF